MNTLERATAARDTSGLIVKPPTPTGMNLLPSSPSAAIRSGLPGTIIGQPDALRQFYSRIQGQQRLFQPLSKVATAAAAPAQVQARTAAMQVISGLTQNQVPDTSLYSRVPTTLLNTLAHIDLATYKGTWKPNILYKQGDEVEDAQYIWQAAAENINSEPSRANPNWNLLGITTLKSFQGAYVGGSSYNAGEEVDQNGNIYQSLVDDNTQAPPGSQWQLIGPASIDNIAEGAQYGKVVQGALTNGQPDLSKAGILGKTLEYIADSGSRFAVVQIDGSGRAIIDLSQAHFNKILDFIGDGSTWKRVANVGTGNQTTTASYESGSISSSYQYDQVAGGAFVNNDSWYNIGLDTSTARIATTSNGLFEISVFFNWAVQTSEVIDTMMVQINVQGVNYGPFQIQSFYTPAGFFAQSTFTCPLTKAGFADSGSDPYLIAVQCKSTTYEWFVSKGSMTVSLIKA